MELSRDDSKMIQGLSVLAMVWLHLFNRNYIGLFTPVLFWDGVPLSFYISQLCDFCVFGFAFCSGYGHMKQGDSLKLYKHRLKSLLLLLCNYWLIILVFSIISIILGEYSYMPGSVGELIMNVTTLDNSYNGAWWYMFSYIILVVLSPVLMKGVRRFHPIVVLGIGFVIYCISFYIRFYYPVSNWFFAKMGPLGMTLFEYLIGAECSNYQLFSKIHAKRIHISNKICGVVEGLVLIGILYGHTKIIPNVFIAPITGFVIIIIFHFVRKPNVIKQFFLFIGSHSTNIWLTHMFFYSVLFEDLVYIAKYPLFIFVFMLGIVISVSIILKTILKSIQCVIR